MEWTKVNRKGPPKIREVLIIYSLHWIGKDTQRIQSFCRGLISESSWGKETSTDNYIYKEIKGLASLPDLKVQFRPEFSLKPERLKYNTTEKVETSK